MAVFDKKETGDYTKGGVNALLGEGVSFEGKLTFNGTVRIDGRFSGEIDSEGRLIVGEKAQITATVQVGAVEVSGRVIGDIIAKTRIDLRSSGQVEGDISAPTVTVEEGGKLLGSCRMGAEATAPRQATKGAPNKGAENAPKMELADAKR